MPQLPKANSTCLPPFSFHDKWWNPNWWGQMRHLFNRNLIQMENQKNSCWRVHREYSVGGKFTRVGRRRCCKCVCCCWNIIPFLEDVTGKELTLLGHNNVKNCLVVNKNIVDSSELTKVEMILSIWFSTYSLTDVMRVSIPWRC